MEYVLVKGERVEVPLELIEKGREHVQAWHDELDPEMVAAREAHEAELAEAARLAELAKNAPKTAGAPASTQRTAPSQDANDGEG